MHLLVSEQYVEILFKPLEFIGVLLEHVSSEQAVGKSRISSTVKAPGKSRYANDSQLDEKW